MSDVDAVIEGNLEPDVANRRRLTFGVALYNRADEPRYVTRVQLLRDGVSITSVAAAHEASDAEEIANEAGLGVFTGGAGVVGISERIAERIAEAVLRRLRHLELPILLGPKEIVRGPCRAYVTEPTDGDWTVSAVVREEASEQTDTADAKD